MLEIGGVQQTHAGLDICTTKLVQYLLTWQRPVCNTPSSPVPFFPSFFPIVHIVHPES